jgi:hypothetical protein
MGTKPLFTAHQYTYRLLWSEDKQRYLGVCSEFPILVYEATTTNDALAGIERRVAEELADLTRQKKPHPEPQAVRRFG